MKIISFDTSFIVDFLREEEEAALFIQIYEFEKAVVPSVADLEARWGGEPLGRFSDFDKPEFNEEDVDKALEIKNFLQEKGEMINKLDILIAAQSINSSSILVSGDSDFRKLEDFQGFDHIHYRRYVNQNG